MKKIFHVSTQYSMMYTFQSSQTSGKMLHIEAENGVEILTFVPTKTYQSVVISSPRFENGVTYAVYSGGKSSGTLVDGLYSDGTYTSGDQVASFAITSIVTGAGAAIGGFPGGPGSTRPTRP